MEGSAEHPTTTRTEWSSLAKLEKEMESLKVEDQDQAQKRTYLAKWWEDCVSLLRSRLRKNCKTEEELPKLVIEKELCDAILELIWDIEILEVDECFAHRILSQLKPHFDNEHAENELGVKTSDISDLLEFKPTEILGDKCCQILLHFSLGDIDSTIEELQTLKRFMSHPAILRNVENLEGYTFVAESLELFINKVSGRDSKLIIFADPEKDDNGNSKIPLIETLSIKGQVTVMVTKCHLVRNFRHRSLDRLTLLKEVIENDGTNPEWYITRAEMWRRKRRDSQNARAKRPVAEEFQLVAEAYSMAPENPFVRLAMLDCIIDCIRDSRGYFTCGEIKFDNADDTMGFMKETCRDILREFPNSVRLHSQISDYFARFVSFRYFDVEYSEECLQRAYQLNPKNPRTTHRLGIFTRMSKGDISTSFEWFKKTVALEPRHFNATMECIKNMMAKMEEYDVIKYIENTVRSPASTTWTESEVMELLFYEGLAYFMKDDMEKAYETWEPVCLGNEFAYRLTDLDRTMGFYEWDEKLITTDKLRLWIKSERDAMNENERNAGDGEVDADRKELVDLLYSFLIGFGGRSTGHLPPPPSCGLFKQSANYKLLKAKITASKNESGDQ